MTTYKFPDLAILRKFKEYKPEIYGVYIDYGEFTISEPKNALIIGNTIATINCAELAKNRIILMHGARAIINASGYSIIRVEKDDASEVTFTKQDHARILL